MPLFQNHCTTFIENSAPFNQNLQLTPQAPDTADHMNVFGFGIMGILAAGVAVTLIALRRKHS